MFHWLAVNFVDVWSPINILGYLSTRSVLALLSSLAMMLIFAPMGIAYLQKHKLRQPIRDDGPKEHLGKHGTPTMGGILIIICLIASSLLWSDISQPFVWLAVGISAAFAFIGFIDDRAKLIKDNSRGLSMRSKIILQTGGALVFLYLLLQTYPVADGLLNLAIPYTKNIVLPLGVVGFFIFGALVIVGSSNAVNLTDGLDGLAMMPAAMIGGGLGIYAYLSGNIVFADYLYLPHIPGVQELVIFCASLFGAGLGFLWFNAYPAEVFMGDTGSLAIGAVLGFIAIATQQELIFAIMSGIFVVEAVSVMIQVVSFKLFGRRVFRMAPLHHHFELKGWRENQVVIRFWIITVVLVMIGIMGIKVR